MEGLKICALIVHDKDENKNGLKDAHIHGYLEFSKQKTIASISSVLAIEPQYVEAPKKGRYGRLNCLAYLIHAKNLDKYQYSPEEVETFETFDYEEFIDDNLEDFKKYNATDKRKKGEIGLDLALQEVQEGKLKLRAIMRDENLALLYANHMNQFNDSFNFYGLRNAMLRLDELEQGKYDLTVLYIQGAPGIGKSFLAREVANKVREFGNANGFESDIFSASSSNPFDDYYGEDILILDDLRQESLKVSDWLKLFDPLNTAKMSARYRNKMIVPRLVIVANYQTVEQFFGSFNFKNEDINQFKRRINLISKISEKTFGIPPFDRIYSLSASKKLNEPENMRISKNEFITLNYGTKLLFTYDDKEKFINELLTQHVYPRIFSEK
ncbi:Replication protein [Lactococcus lactis subsp. lactis]|uniref:Rep family protein n=1 Tax=Lactococcus lactis TaxID=1358 RepID=UPI00071D1C2A|nr:Rep family protein [Lactococcus lactis]ARE11757.1 Rep family protein [Lactococcus lactis subsp. lactis]KSU32505.1 Replication protein [Lactococcus lactis subsp. lactis]URL08467.1 plasmid replication protein [Lactococcus lactis subsp. lactis]